MDYLTGEDAPSSPVPRSAPPQVVSVASREHQAELARLGRPRREFRPLLWGTLSVVLLPVAGLGVHTPTRDRVLAITGVLTSPPSATVPDPAVAPTPVPTDPTPAALPTLPVPRVQPTAPATPWAPPPPGPTFPFPSATTPAAERPVFPLPASTPLPPGLFPTSEPTSQWITCSGRVLVGTYVDASDPERWTIRTTITNETDYPVEVSDHLMMQFYQNLGNSPSSVYYYQPIPHSELAPGARKVVTTFTSDPGRMQSAPASSNGELLDMGTLTAQWSDREPCINLFPDIAYRDEGSILAW